jgi:hypothetical protein
MKRLIVRVLVDLMVEGLSYKTNQVVDFPEKVIRDHVQHGSVDASPEAVDYCKSELKATVLVHEARAVAEKRLELEELRKQDAELAAQFQAEKDAEKRDAIAKKGDELHAKAQAVAEELAKLESDE